MKLAVLLLFLSACSDMPERPPASDGGEICLSGSGVCELTNPPPPNMPKPRDAGQPKD